MKSKFNTVTKKTILSVTLTATALLSGCASKNLSTSSTQYYHAPAQAYDLFLGNTAITGQPTLRESCSERGSSLEIVDASGDFFRVDVINLLSQPHLVTANKEQSAKAIGDYFYQLYGAPFINAPRSAVPVNNRKQLYIPLPLDHPGPVADKGRVLGMLVSKYDNFLLSVQHVQQFYNQQQMLEKLTALQTAMSIPGRLINPTPKKLQDKDGKDSPEALGFMNIDPNSASPDDIANWRKEARCL